MCRPLRHYSQIVKGPQMETDRRQQKAVSPPARAWTSRLEAPRVTFKGDKVESLNPMIHDPQRMPEWWV
jgi:hypothetical protein